MINNMHDFGYLDWHIYFQEGCNYFNDIANKMIYFWQIIYLFSIKIILN